MATNFKSPNLNNYFLNVRNLEKDDHQHRGDPSSMVDDSEIEPLQNSVGSLEDSIH